MGWFENRSTKEKKSHFKNLVAVALADGKLDDAEAQLLARIGVRMGMDMKEINALLTKPEKVKLVLPTDQREKITQMIDVVAMMIIDGDADPREIQFCMALAVQMGLDPAIVKTIAEKLLEAASRGTSPDAAVNDLASIL